MSYVNKILTGFIVMLPVLMMYKFPFTEKSCVTVLVLLFLPVFLFNAIYAFFKYYNKQAYQTIFLFLYCMWGILKCAGSPTNLWLFFVTYIFIVAVVVSNLFDMNTAKKIIENISIFASIVVAIQHFLHYTFGLLSPVVFVYPWLIDYMQNKIDSTTMEVFFRPSAFFAEPSHFAQYAVIGLLSVLFLNKDCKISITKAVIISLGILMTTSGIGIVLMLASWGLWVLKNTQKKRSLYLRILAGLTVGPLAYFVLMQFNFFSKAIQRIFGEVDGYNAISGRLFWWDTYFSNLSTHDWIFGLGYNALPTIYFTGFMELVYATGIIGFTLFSMAIINCMRHTEGFYLYLSIIYLGLLFVANLTNFIYMIFWLSLIYYGCKQTKVSQIIEYSNFKTAFRYTKSC